jgi:hypothetical protein
MTPPTTMMDAECAGDRRDDKTMEYLIDAEEDVILSIAKFLPAKDCLNLHAVSRGLHHVVSKHDEALFGHHLYRDFAEGYVLLYVTKKKNLSRKKLYRAFLGRWSLPKQADEKLREEKFIFDYGDRNTKIITTWVQPPNIASKNYQGAKLLIPNDDVDNVVFIARVGEGVADGHPNRRCALMEWNSEFDPNKRNEWQQLIIDKSWCDDAWELTPPQDQQVSEGWCTGKLNVGQLTEALKSTHTLTLHAIDTRYYHVASLLESTPLEDFMYNADEEPDFSSHYGDRLPSLWGVPPKFSPFHRKLTEKDFKYYFLYEGDGYDEDPRPPLEYLPIRGKLLLNDWKAKHEDKDDFYYGIDLYHPQKGLNFNFLGYDGSSSIQRPHQICSFLRTLMKEKCVQVDPRETMKISIVQQPEWVNADKILDEITSYASFEDQAGKLRLVCRQFGASALRQLEAKLDKIKVIGFSREGECGDSWFKATVRRGWSDTCLTSKESAIDDALWLASCRCCFQYCADKDSCKNASKPLTCHGYSSESKKYETLTVDEAFVRQKLAEVGQVQLTETSPDELCWAERDDYWKPSNVVKCSFEEDEMNLFELCRNIGKAINSHSDEYEYEEEGERVPLNWHLKRDYGVSKRISSRQFVRSIFLIFARAENKITISEEDESAEKKARVTPSQKVTIGMAKTNIATKIGSYSRMKKIIRFKSAANEPLEICLESRSSYCE